MRLAFLRHIPKVRWPVTTEDYWPAVETMVEADVGSKIELFVRYFVVIYGGIFVTFATGRYEVAIWVAAFILANGYYSWRLSRITSPVSRGQYTRLIALFAVSVTLYTSCVVYLFTLNTQSFVTIAVAGLVAQALFNISRHRKSSILVVYDTAIVVAAALFCGLSGLTKTQGGVSEQMVIMVSILGVCVYYIVAQIRKIQIHEALQTSRQAAAQTQKMQAVGQLTAGVAHEFNNLLTVIRGNVELAQLMDGAGEFQERLADAIKAADRADALTSQLLSLSRKARLEAAEINLPDFWTGFDVILPRITPASIEIRVQAVKGPEVLYCDINQLEVALINLVINARDAMDGKGRIDITSRMATARDLQKMGIGAKSAPLGLIEIRDNGPGIPPQLLQQVIEPFFTTKGVGKGTGLGLPMVKGFCEQSGGGFALESNARGTAAFLALPTTRR